MNTFDTVVHTTCAFIVPMVRIDVMNHVNILRDTERENTK